jgi:hypothetical protein
MIIFFDEISARIAEDLGIPVDKVKEVMLKAADDKLLTIEGDHVVIEDIRRILQTASRVKTMLDQ